MESTKSVPLFEGQQTISNEPVWPIYPPQEAIIPTAQLQRFELSTSICTVFRQTLKLPHIGRWFATRRKDFSSHGHFSMKCPALGEEEPNQSVWQSQVIFTSKSFYKARWISVIWAVNLGEEIDKPSLPSQWGASITQDLEVGCEALGSSTRSLITRTISPGDSDLSPWWPLFDAK